MPTKPTNSRRPKRSPALRKRAEDSQKAAVDFTNSLIVCMQDGFSLLDTSGVALDVNPALCQMTGFSRAELVAVGPPHPYWPPEEYEHIQAALNQTLKGHSAEFELVFMRRNGERFPVIVSPFAVKNQAGDTVGYAATVKDITTRVQVKRALREANSRLLLALDASSAGVWSWDARTGVAEWDARYHRLYGFAPEEPASHAAWLERVHPEDRDRLMAQIQALILPGAGETWDEEFRALHPTLGVRWMSGLGRVERDAAGRAVLFVGINLDITERKVMERALRDSEYKYRNLIETLQDGFVSVDMTGRVLECNPAFEAMVGYSAAQLHRMTYQELTPERWHETDARIVRDEILPHGYSAVFEKEYRRADGTVFPVELRVGSIRDAAGQAVSMWAVVRDITARKQIEAAIQRLNDKLEARIVEGVTALQTSEQRFRTLVAASFEGVVLSRNGRILDCNDQLAKILGRQREQLLDREILEFIAPASQDNVRHLIQDGADARLEQEVIRGDGSSCAVESHGHSPDGRDGVRVTVLRDITERKRAEQALRESEARFRQLAEAAFEGIVVLDSGKFLDCNAQFTAMFGYELNELIGRFVTDVVALESRQGVEERVRAEREGPYEFLGLRKDGTIFPAEARSRMIVQAGRHIRITALRDLTAIRAASAAFEFQRVKLIRSQRLAELSEASLGVIHQIGQPLSAVMATVSAIKSRVAQCEAQSSGVLEAILEVDADLKRVRETMERIRALAHPERPRRRPTDLNVLVADLVRLSQPDAEARQIQVRADLSAGLPAASLDEVQMSQAILNVLRNAFDAVSECDPVRRVVMLSTQSDGDGHVELTITDLGGGLKPEALSQLFEPFFTTKPDGMGVGLRLAHTILKAHGGNLEGFNNEGTGATFRLRIPCRSASA